MILETLRPSIGGDAGDLVAGELETYEPGTGDDARDDPGKVATGDGRRHQSFSSWGLETTLDA